MITSPAKESSTIHSKDAACEMSQSLNDAAHNAARKVRSMLHSASDEISHASDQFSSEVRLNPMRSTMIALGVGAVIGALLRK